MATKYDTSSQVRCQFCNTLVKPSFLTRHINVSCYAQPKSGQNIQPGTCPHCLKSLTVTKMETHLLHECPRLTVQCPFCSYRFKDILQHLWKKHREKRFSEQFKRTKNPPDPYQSKEAFVEPGAPRHSEVAPDIPKSRESCPICHTHMGEYKLQKHVAIHCKVICPCCNNKVKKTVFQNHLNSCLAKQSSGSVKCPVCTKQGSLHSIAQHLSENHHTLCCPVCSNTVRGNRALDHLRKCSNRNSAPSHMQSPLIPGVFQKFRESQDNAELCSGSDATSDETSDDELAEDVTPVRSKPARKAKPFHAPFIDLTDPEYILLPATPEKRGKKKESSGDHPTPSVDWNHKISCPICNTDCPLRMVGRHITDTHISQNCPVCNSNVSHNSFKVHLEECMGRYGVKEEKGRAYFPCPYCSLSKPSVRQISTHITRTHRELDCPFCQESYGPRKYTKHVNDCARLSVVSAQLIQENPSASFDPEVLQLYQDVASSEHSSDSDSDSDDYISLRTDETRGCAESNAVDNDILEEGESIICCIFCGFQCVELPLEDHIAECASLPVGMQLVSLPDLLGIRIN